MNINYIDCFDFITHDFEYFNLNSLLYYKCLTFKNVYSDCIMYNYLIKRIICISTSKIYDFRKFVNLKFLVLQYTHLPSLRSSKTLRLPYKLIYLDSKSNHIKNIEFGNFKCMKILKCKDVYIPNISKLKGLKILHYLYFDKQNVDVCIDNFYYLKELEISRTNTKNIIISNCKKIDRILFLFNQNLYDISIKNSQIKNLIIHVSDIRNLDISDISNLDLFTCNWCQNLSEIKLPKNLKKTQLTNLINLNKINIQNLNSKSLNVVCDDNLIDLFDPEKINNFKNTI